MFGCQLAVNQYRISFQILAIRAKQLWYFLLNKINCFVTYKEWSLLTLLIFRERILNANLRKEHLLGRVVRSVLDNLQVFPD